MAMNNFLELWNSHGNFTWWQSILIGTFFIVCDLVLCLVNWLLQQETIIECGYPKTKNKTFRKRLKNFSFLEMVLMYRLVKEAKQKGFIIYLCFFINCINIAACISCIVAYIGVIITCGAGWAMLILTLPALGILLLGAAIRFIPDLIWVPSERKRYGISKKKK